MGAASRKAMMLSGLMWLPSTWRGGRTPPCIAARSASGSQRERGCRRPTNSPTLAALRTRANAATELPARIFTDVPVCACASRLLLHL